jgi:hypothetical protein
MVLGPRRASASASVSAVPSASARDMDCAPCAPCARKCARRTRLNSVNITWKRQQATRKSSVNSVSPMEHTAW